MSGFSIAGSLHAILVDVDGTLYRQAPLRLKIAAELIQFSLAAPLEFFQTARILRTFRRKREVLRLSNADETPLVDLQYTVAADEASVDHGRVAHVVSEWIERRPLRHLLACRREGIVSFLSCCRSRGIAVGAYSDYPTKAKVAALGLADFFDLHLCSTDPEINAFKPSPAGIAQACKQWHLDPDCVMYIGDREDIDGAAAKAAGVRFVLMGKGKTGEPAVRDFYQLKALLGWHDL
jgi:FMN phosphatase YigB (HAD superfamily)